MQHLLPWGWRYIPEPIFSSHYGVSSYKVLSTDEDWSSEEDFIHHEPLAKYPRSTEHSDASVCHSDLTCSHINGDVLFADVHTSGNILLVATSITLWQSTSLICHFLVPLLPSPLSPWLDPLPCWPRPQLLPLTQSVLSCVFNIYKIQGKDVFTACLVLGGEELILDCCINKKN